MKQLLLDIQPPSPPTLNNFVVGRNAEALHSLQSLLQPESAQHASLGEHFVYLWGDTGSGKSHLLQAAAQVAKTPLVVVDDVQHLDEDAQIALFNTYNHLRAEGGMLIAAGNASPTQMGLRDDLATRLAWGLVYQLHPLTDEEKAQALRNHAQARGMKLPDEVIEYCLRYLRRDLSSLIATLDALDEWSLVAKKPVTLPLLRQLLQLPLHLSP